MTLTDVMSGSELSLFPIAGLVVFMVAAVGIGWRVLAPSRRVQDAHTAMLPLNESLPVSRCVDNEEIDTGACINYES